MSSISTRWSVAQEHPVAPDDLEDGSISDRAVARWVALARGEYLDQSAVLAATRARAGLVLRCDLDLGADRPPFGPAPSVVVTASATEVFAASFVIAARLRTLGAERDDLLNIASTVRLEDPATGEAHAIGDEIRDELIALEHAARHFN